MLKRLVQTDDDISRLVVRVALGAAIFPHGAQKLLGWFGGGGFGKTVDFFSQQLGIPAVLTVLIILAESLGALSLIVGFLSRFCAFGIALIMLGAVAMIHSRVGFFMNWYGTQQGEGFEYHILALGLAIAVMIKGAGKWSVDRMLTEKL